MDDEISLQGCSHASSSHEDSLEPTTKRREDLFTLSSLKTEIARSAKGPKIQGPRAEDAMVSEAVPRAEIFGDLTTADHKVLNDNCESRNNHRCAVVVQDLATQWIQAHPCKNKNSTRNPEETCKSFWSPRGNQKSFTLTIPWNSAKLVKIFHGIIARLHHTDRRLMVLRKEQCAE